MASKRKTFYRADLDDRTNKTVIHTKQRVYCPEGYTTNRKAALKEYMERMYAQEEAEKAAKPATKPKPKVAKPKPKVAKPKPKVTKRKLPVVVRVGKSK